MADQSWAKHVADVLRRNDIWLFATVPDFIETLRRLPSPFDFVLVDLGKDLYVLCLEMFHGKLWPNAFVAADNMIFPPNPQYQEAYRRAARAKVDMESFLVPIGSGVELGKKRGA
jgi:predicted O-methyltransferase YrrM